MVLCSLPALLLLSPFAQTTWHVDASAVEPGDGSLANPYSRIDYAVAQSTTISGDTVLVKPGTYTDEQIDLADKAIQLIGELGSSQTIIHQDPSFGAPGDGTHAPIRAEGIGPGTATIQGFQFRNSSGEDLGAHRVGGAFYILNSNILITGCTTEGTHAFAGGVLWCSGSDVSVQNCIWNGQTKGLAIGGGLYQHGGVVHATNSTLSFSGSGLNGNCDAYNERGAGGVMFLSQCETEIVGGAMTTNMNTTIGDFAQGGFVWMDGGKLDASNLQLVQNIQWCIGGSIYALNAEVNITNCSFSKSTFGGFYTAGGALLLGNCKAVIDSCTFHQNGGHVAADQGTTFSIGAGGAISSTGSLELSNSVFTRNAADYGGAVYSVGGHIRNCEFSNNESAGRFNYSGSTKGGAVYLREGVIENCVFTGNHTTVTYEDYPNFPTTGRVSEGGAIWASNSKISHCAFIGNGVHSSSSYSYGTGRGGAICGLYGSLEIDSCIFQSNYIDRPSDLAGYNSGYLNGSAVFLNNQSTVTNCVFNGNYIQPAANIQGSSGTVEGGRYIQCTFSGNSSPTNLAASRGDFGNCIFQGTGSQNFGVNTSTAYCLSDQPISGIGCFQADPLLWPDESFRLLPGSPAIDAGSPFGPTDADGTVADIGAFPYESSYCGTACANALGTHPCPSNPNSTGLIASIQATGSDLVHENFVQLSSSGLPALAPGFYLASLTPDFVPLFRNSDGNLCVGGPIYRLNDQPLVASPNGSMARHLDLNPLPRGPLVLPGSTWYFQLWYRDSDSSTGESNTSGSVEVNFN